MIMTTEPSRLPRTVRERVERVAQVLREHRGRPVRVQVIVDRLREEVLTAVNKTFVCHAVRVLRAGFGWRIDRGYYGLTLAHDPPALTWPDDFEEPA